MQMKRYLKSFTLRALWGQSNCMRWTRMMCCNDWMLSLLNPIYNPQKYVTIMQLLGFGFAVLSWKYAWMTRCGKCFQWLHSPGLSLSSNSRTAWGQTIMAFGMWHWCWPQQLWPRPWYNGLWSAVLNQFIVGLCLRFVIYTAGQVTFQAKTLALVLATIYGLGHRLRTIGIRPYDFGFGLKRSIKCHVVVNLYNCFYSVGLAFRGWNSLRTNNDGLGDIGSDFGLSGSGLGLDTMASSQLSWTSL